MAHNTQDQRRLRRPLHPLVRWRRIIKAMEPKEQLPMGTYKAKCDICFEETDVPNYGDWDCPHCHQPYTYDECHQIRLTDAQWEALRNPPRWIPVTERLPEKGVPVIGWFPGATHSFECALNEHDGVWCDYGTGIYLYEDERPTHWMPFPDGPTDAK